MPAQLPDDARCLHCNYLLRGLSEDKCPECGREFDSDDRMTFRVPRVRPIRLPPTNFALIACVVYVAIFLVPMMDPSSFDRWFPLDPARLGGPLIPLVILALLAANGIARSYFGSLPTTASSIKHRRWRWIALAIWSALSISLLFGRPDWMIPQAQFALSRSAIEEEVARHTKHLPLGIPCFISVDRQVGLFYVRYIQIDTANEVYVHVRSFGDRWGFMRTRPDASPNRPAGELSGGWRIGGRG